MSPTGSGTLLLMRSLRFALRLIHHLGDTAGKGCRSGSDLHLKCFSVLKMHELIEGLRGVEVIADDSVVVGYGELWQSAIKDHDRNLVSFLQRCDERGVHLNSDKLQLRMKEVPLLVMWPQVKVFAQIHLKFRQIARCPHRKM